VTLDRNQAKPWPTISGPRSDVSQISRHQPAMDASSAGISIDAVAFIKHYE
jgi:hypothetical protein